MSSVQNNKKTTPVSNANVAADPKIQKAEKLDKIEKAPLSPVRNTVVGMASAACDLAIDQPLVTLKTWRQNSNTSVVSSLRNNWRHLYSGVGPMYMSYGSAMGIVFFQMSLYDKMLKQYAPNVSEARRKMYAAALSGGVTATFWGAPLEGIMVKQQMAAAEKKPMNVLQVIRHVGQTTGYRSLWRGAPMQALREIGFVSTVSSPEVVAKQLFPKEVQEKHSAATNAAASVVVGLTGATITNPPDVMKSRMQQVNGPKTWEAFKQVAKERAFFKGLGVRATSYVWGALIYDAASKVFTPMLEPKKK